MKAQTNTLTFIWLLLVAATLVAWFLGQHPGTAMVRLAPRVAAGIFVLAFAKVALVMAYFMELRRAPYALCALAGIWVIGECSVLVWLFT